MADMLNTPFAAPLLLLLAAPAIAADAPSWAQASGLLQQHITVHVPRVTTRTTIIMRSPVPAPMMEKKAGDCVKIEKITGFSVTRGNNVDLLLDNGRQLRVKLEDRCRALGFYSGFYLKPTDDKKICAGRDSFRSRSGGSCGIIGFSTLVPAR